jgi:hypothetical protein
MNENKVTIEKWETGKVICTNCEHLGVTVIPYGTPEPFECPKCLIMSMVFEE